MNASKLMSFNNYTVYYVSTNDFSYYISIPHNKNVGYHMAIDLDKYIDILLPNINKMNDEIKSIYQDIDNTSMILILPNLDFSILNNLDNEKAYLKLAKKVTSILNNAHKLLTTNNIIVNSSVYFLDDQKYNNFITYFGNKFKGRVAHINVFRILKEFSFDKNGYTTNSLIHKVNVGGLNYIIGKENSEVIRPYKNNLELDAAIEKKKKEEELLPLKPVYASSGNVSYLLLGAVILIVVVGLVIVLIR